MKRMVKKISILIFKILFALLIISSLWVFSYKFINPPVSGMMVYKSITEDNYTFSKIWKDIEEISPFLPLSFIAAEDQLYLEHNGFDIEAIKEAIEHNKDSDRKRGASTISQQVAKNVFLFPTKSFFRKGLEVYYTFLIELMWSKRRIMEVYLNVVELGYAVYGVEQASIKYFGISSSKMNKAKSALMGTVLPNPLVFKLNKPSTYMIKRRDWVMRQMDNLGGTYILNSWYE